MCELLHQLYHEGYIREDRSAELLERTLNMKRGRGFVTNAKLESEAQTQKEEIEDLLS
jgi:acetolactate synthase regulatory subunit